MVQMDHKLVISQEGADTLVRLITGISKNLLTGCAII